MNNDDLVVKGREVKDSVPSASPEDPPAQATTTSEENLHTASQRSVNMLWEHTQQKIALSVCWVGLAVAAYLALQGQEPDIQVAACVFLYGVANLVIGFYFGRTNHQRTGGVTEGR